MGHITDLIESFSEPMQTHKDYCNVYECMVGDNGNDINEQLLIGFQILDVVARYKRSSLVSQLNHATISNKLTNRRQRWLTY